MVSYLATSRRLYTGQPLFIICWPSTTMRGCSVMMVSCPRILTFAQRSLGLQLTSSRISSLKFFRCAAVVLMPPTLVAGIYRHEFRAHAGAQVAPRHPFAIGLILASAIIPYWLARRSGWL